MSFSSSVTSLEDVEQSGLYLYDLNISDGSRDLVSKGWQHASCLEYSIDQVKISPIRLYFLLVAKRQLAFEKFVYDFDFQQVAKSKQIEETIEQTNQQQKKSESLLYSMIPKTVVRKIEEKGLSESWEASLTHN